MSNSRQRSEPGSPDAYDASVLDACLPQLVAEVARLRGENARLEASVRMRDERTALVVHELRQPLSLLILTAALLGPRTAGDEKRLLESLRKGGTRLSSIVSDLSDTSLLESGAFALHLAPTDISGLVATSIERFDPRALVSVDGDIPLLDVDPLRVEQILTNLLVNAQKYGSKESVPSIAIARGAGIVVVTVTNEGCAVSDDERIKIFEPYYRGRDRKPDARSLGLGLYICRRLVEEHGGRIWTDGDSSYARFSFSLPVPEPAPRVSEQRIILVKRPLARARARATAPWHAAEGERGEARQAPHRREHGAVARRSC